MEGDNQQTQFLNDLIDVVTELLNQGEQNPVNPPTPSLNDFSEVEDDTITITKEEARQLLNIIDELNTSVAANKVVSDNQQQVTEEKFDQERKTKEELREEIKEDLKNELLTEGEFVEKSTNYTFKDELTKQAKKYHLVKLTIVSGEQIEGVLCKIHDDFIVLITSGNQFTKIPIGKITSITIINNNQQDKQQTEKKKAKNTTQETNKEGASEKETSEFKEKLQLPTPKEMFNQQMVTVRNNETNFSN
ncbi:hypothetical protein [Halanaerobaculum tunisiense]